MTEPEDSVERVVDGRRSDIELNRVQERYRRSVLAKLQGEAYRLESVAECLCGTGEAISVAEHDRFGLPVGVVACMNCGLARTTPRLAAADLPRFYQEDYHGLHMGVPEPDPSMSLFRAGQGAIIHGKVADLLPHRHIRIAEIGCGTGQVLREFLDAASQSGRSGEAIGCEYAPAYVRAGRSVGSDIREGGADVLENDGPFDLVILSHVLEHFADVPAEMTVISHLVGDRGLVYVEVPGVLSIHRKPEYDFEFIRYFTVAHTYHFCLDTLVDVMHRAGFELVSGDEEIRSVFRTTALTGERAVSRGPDTLLRYLDWLTESRTVRIKRIILRSGRRSKDTARRTMRALLGGRIYGLIRGAARRLGILR